MKDDKDLKKSDFGALCDSYRGKRQMSIADMAEALERQGYKLGKTGNPKSQQPLISQYERRIGDTELDRKKHLDPPLKYVEACAKLFNLNTVEKYEFLVAALNSSSIIKIDKVIPKGKIRDEMTSILASLYLGGDMIPMEMSVESKQQDGMTVIASPNKKDEELMIAWDTFVYGANKLSEAIKTNAFKLYKKELLKAGQNSLGEKTI
jgi:hypothetical protein